MAELRGTRGTVLAPERPNGMPPSPPPRSLPWWLPALLILCAFAALGVGPAIVSGDLLGAWRLGGFGSAIPPLAPTATPAPDLALPRQAWIATESHVLARPGSGAGIALLEPGFPVTLTEHARGAGASWSHIQWGGPSTNAGGSGWVLDSSLVGFDSGARALGDLGALSPSLGSSVAGYQSRFAAALYFPDSGQLYRANTDTSLTLADAFRPILLAADFAAAERQHAAAPATSAASLAMQVASGSAVATATLYEQLGDARGLVGFLDSAGITGISPAPLDWAATRGTPNALLQFYALLAAGNLLSSADSTSLLSLLAQASASSANPLWTGQALGSGFLLTATDVSGSATTVLVSGIVAPNGGPRYVAVLSLTGQGSATSEQAVLSAFFGRLSAVLGES